MDKGERVAGLKRREGVGIETEKRIVPMGKGLMEELEGVNWREQ